MRRIRCKGLSGIGRKERRRIRRKGLSGYKVIRDWKERMRRIRCKGLSG